MLNKKTTTEQALDAALSRLAGEISAQTLKRNSALAVFEKTLGDLQAANLCLETSIEKLDKLTAEAAKMKESANAAMEHNAATMKRINEILEG